ncbi:MAG: hypothetical protein E7668_05195 [Ruminococcaceae bacterium]|nr:hypothetical protein [Oscillospiraceae bacterium]
MGKSNRIRVNRAKTQGMTLNVQKKKKGMPSWLMTLITLVVTVAVLLTVIISLLSANGVFNRMRTAVATENYKVNVNMMSYYFRNQYQSFHNNYSSYISMLSLDVSEGAPSLKDQPFGGGDTTETNEDGTAVTYYDTMLLGEFEGSWFDYFMDQTVESVKGVLVYCEEADVRGIELEDEDKEAIEESISELNESATSYGYSLNAYISAMYGEGVTISDVRKAMEYSALATKCMNAISEELEADLVESNRIEEAYNAGTKTYNRIDYSSYAFTVDYDTVAKEVLADLLSEDTELSEVLENADNKKKADDAYLAEIGKAKAAAEELAKLTDAEAFEKYVVEYVAADVFEDLYTDALGDAEKPTGEGQEETLKNKIYADAVKEALDGKDEVTEVVKLEETEEPDENATVEINKITVKVAYAEALNQAKSDLFAKLTSAMSSAKSDKASFTDDQKADEESFSDWAFADGRKAGEVKTVTTGSETAVPEDSEATVDAYSVTVYLLRAPQYRDTEKARNVAYMLFNSTTDATKAISALITKDNLSLADFEAYADENGATGHTHIEDYTKGTLGSDAFDKWLFDEKNSVGTLTESYIQLADGTFAVAYWYGEGNELWYVEVKTALLNEDFEAYYTDMEATYAGAEDEKIKVNTSACNAVDA